MRTPLFDRKWRRSSRPGHALGLAVLLAIFGSFFPGNGTAVLHCHAEPFAAHPPARIVSLAPGVTEIVFALGEGQRLVGVTELCDYPEKARSIARVGGFLSPDLERIAALKPDLCLAAWNGSPPPATGRMKELGIPFFAVHPEDMDGVMEAVGTIGRLLDAGPKADELVRGMRERLDRVKSRIALAGNLPGVFFQIGVAPIVSAGGHTLVDELITLAGGRNLAAGPVPFPRFSREQVLALRPEVIVVSSMGRCEVFEKTADDWREWQSLPAAGADRIHVVDSNLFDRPTPRLIEGLELLARIIHPELFGI
ncbi:MAG: cobalamin-binding protein [Desulfobacteraceae bacterium]|nr:cobalamin-binding protein [Desulfobacteraceae bacterium]